MALRRSGLAGAEFAIRPSAIACAGLLPEHRARKLGHHFPDHDHRGGRHCIGQHSDGKFGVVSFSVGQTSANRSGPVSVLLSVIEDARERVPSAISARGHRQPAARVAAEGANALARHEIGKRPQFRASRILRQQRQAAGDNARRDLQWCSPGQHRVTVTTHCQRSFIPLPARTFGVALTMREVRVSACFGCEKCSTQLRRRPGVSASNAVLKVVSVSR